MSLDSSEGKRKSSINTGIYGSFSYKIICTVEKYKVEDDKDHQGWETTCNCVVLYCISLFLLKYNWHTMSQWSQVHVIVI